MNLFPAFILRAKRWQSTLLLPASLMALWHEFAPPTPIRDETKSKPCQLGVREPAVPSVGHLNTANSDPQERNCT